jgi:hypothetical protein
MRRLVFFVICGLFCLAGCSRSPIELTAKTEPNDEKNSTGASRAPFATKEPEKYRAQIVFAFQTDENAEPLEQTTFVARDGANRRLDFENDGKIVSRIENADGKRFVLLPARKVYAEIVSSASETVVATEPLPEEISLAALLHIKPAEARFERVGEEEVLNRRTTKYRVDYGAISEDENLRTETFVWADDALGMPVKTEISALENGRRNGARSVMEMREIIFDVDGQFFAVPKDFRKISVAEIYANLK